MGRKRCSSYVESSDDEFELSDVEASPLFSRLKRPKRAHNNKGSAASASPEVNSAQREDDVNCSIEIPDPLERDENSIPESVAESVLQSPKDPRDDDTRETEAPSERGVDVEERNDADDDDDHVEVIEETDDNKDVQQSPNNVPAVKPDNATIPGRRRQTRTVYQIESDSEEEPERDNDDDDAYNSAEDSPPEDDDDSEFDFSLQKPAKRKERAPVKRATSRQKAQTPPTCKPAKRKLGTRKLAVKAPLARSKSPAAVQSTSKLKPTTEGAKRSLGSRLPRRGLMPPKSFDSDRKHAQSSGKLPSAPMIRSGLSRKAIIPRLHAYLQGNVQHHTSQKPAK